MTLEGINQPLTDGELMVIIRQITTPTGALKPPNEVQRIQTQTLARLIQELREHRFAPVKREPASWLEPTN